MTLVRLHLEYYVQFGGFWYKTNIDKLGKF